jgi:hypothetical protein
MSANSLTLHNVEATYTKFIVIDHSSDSFKLNKPSIITRDAFYKEACGNLPSNDQNKVRTLSKNLKYTDLVIKVANVAMTVLSLVGIIFDKLSDIKFKIGLGIVIILCNILSSKLQEKIEVITRPIHDQYEKMVIEFEEDSKNYYQFIEKNAMDNLKTTLRSD